MPPICARAGCGANTANAATTVKPRNVREPARNRHARRRRVAEASAAIQPPEPGIEIGRVARPGDVGEHQQRRRRAKSARKAAAVRLASITRAKSSSRARPGRRSAKKIGVQSALQQQLPAPEPQRPPMPGLAPDQPGGDRDHHVERRPDRRRTPRRAACPAGGPATGTRCGSPAAVSTPSATPTSSVSPTNPRERRPTGRRRGSEPRSGSWTFWKTRPSLRSACLAPPRRQSDTEQQRQRGPGRQQRQGGDAGDKMVMTPRQANPPDCPTAS